MSQALQSSQQAMQQAGQKTEKQASSEDGEATESEFGKEFKAGESGDKQGEGEGQKPGGKNGKKPGGQGGSQASTSPGSGKGMGGPGRGAGGSAGAQQPLPGAKKDTLLPYQMGKGDKLTRSYRGTPDPNRDRAAYVEIVPERTRAAESSLNREDIPVGHRKQVRDYFNSIQPGK